MKKARGKVLRGLCLLSCLAATTTVYAACSASASNLSFGNYDTFSGSPLDGAGTITVTCGLLEIYSIALSTGGSGSFSPRTLINGVHALEYNLYTNSSRSTVWGDGTGGTSTIDGSIGALGIPVDHTVYGRIPASQNPLVGSYADTITVTVSF